MLISSFILAPEDLI